MKVWVVTIDHKHGTDSEVHASKASAEAALWGYCDEWWENEFHGVPRPSDDKLVEAYWNRMSERGEEWHTLEECEIKGDVRMPPIFIPENERGVKPGYYTRPDIVRLLRLHKMYPERVQFIADMME
jgi:hypothetical protein